MLVINNRKKKVQMIDLKEVKNNLVKLLDEKKAENIVEFDISAYKNRLSDWCIIASGTSSRHAQAVADYAYKYLKEIKLSPRIEGSAKTGWVMIDAGGIELHIFKPDLREYYNIESLLDGKRPTPELNS